VKEKKATALSIHLEVEYSYLAKCPYVSLVAPASRHFTRETLTTFSAQSALTLLAWLRQEEATLRQLIEWEVSV
jgi:hypothetical protein